MDSKTTNSLIGGLLAIAFVMAVGFAIFTGYINRGGLSESSKWNIYVNSISAGTILGEAKNQKVQIDNNKLSAVFLATLSSPGDEINYAVEVKNAGTLDAKIDNVILNGDNQNIEYKYSGTEKGDIIKAGQSKVFTITMSYNKNVKQQVSTKLNMLLSCVQNN